MELSLFSLINRLVLRLILFLLLLSFLQPFGDDGGDDDDDENPFGADSDGEADLSSVLSGVDGLVAAGHNADELAKASGIVM